MEAVRFGARVGPEALTESELSSPVSVRRSAAGCGSSGSSRDSGKSDASRLAAMSPFKSARPDASRKARSLVACRESSVTTWFARAAWAVTAPMGTPLTSRSSAVAESCAAGFCGSAKAGLRGQGADAVRAQRQAVRLHVGLDGGRGERAAHGQARDGDLAGQRARQGVNPGQEFPAGGRGGVAAAAQSGEEVRHLLRRVGGDGGVQRQRRRPLRVRRRRQGQAQGVDDVADVMRQLGRRLEVQRPGGARFDENAVGVAARQGEGGERLPVHGQVLARQRRRDRRGT